MAFSIFSKPTPKQKGSAPRDGDKDRAGAKGAQNAALTEGKATIWRPQVDDIEVQESQPELCPVLENAALLYANGASEAARKLLADSLPRDPDTQRSPLAWLALFDLLHRAGDRAAFEDLSLRYVVQFERSAPLWDERREAKPVKPQRPAGRGFVSFSGRLALAEATQIPALKKVSEMQPQAQLDVTGLNAADDDACAALADLLRQLRRRGYSLSWSGLEQLHTLIAESVAVSERSNEGHWLLLLEVWQWLNDQNAFEECAINYAVTFEVSPPSWEPIAKAIIKAAAVEPAKVEEVAGDHFVCQGEMLGPADAQVTRLYDFIETHREIVLDFRAVDRVDFVCAGALFNALNHPHAQGKSLVILGASPIVQALLMVLGIDSLAFQAPR